MDDLQDSAVPAQLLGQPLPPTVETPEQHEACVTCVRFDGAGGLLAVGTKGGAIHLYRAGPRGYTQAAAVRAFQTQVDPLTSSEIDSKIKGLCWLKRCSRAGLLLAANDKFIRLYRVAERTGAVVPGSACDDFLGLGYSAAPQLRLPRVVPCDPVIECKTKRVFASEHEYTINALSASSDGDYFLSSDDLVVHLWHTGHTRGSLKLVSLKPDNMDDLNETITTAAFHPEHCNLFSFATSRGATHLCDLRQNVTCRRYAAVFDASACPAPAYVDPFYAPLLNGVSHIAHHPTDSRVFATRDFLTVKVWDTAMPAEPIYVHPVQDHLLQPALAELYETDVIFDRFELAWIRGGRSLATGLYRYEWVAIDVATGQAQHHAAAGSRGPAEAPPFAGCDFAYKALALQPHPTRPLLALGAGGEVALVGE